MLLADYTYRVSGDRCFEFDPETGAYSHFKHGTDQFTHTPASARL